jgi:hypothetical protein
MHLFIVIKPSGSELTPKVREVFEVFAESGEPRGRKTAMLALLLWNMKPEAYDSAIQNTDWRIIYV